MKHAPDVHLGVRDRVSGSSILIHNDHHCLFAGVQGPDGSQILVNEGRTRLEDCQGQRRKGECISISTFNKPNTRADLFKFSVDDFETIRVTPWEGVRNAEARNLMKEMALGDKVGSSLVR